MGPTAREDAEAGTQWWSRRWLSALERAGWANRLERGQSYARAGRVSDLEVEPGRLAARVQGSSRLPYEVEVQVLPMAAGVWRAVAARMTERPRDAAELLAGRLSETVEEVFADAGGRLFPDELLAECTCPDWAAPCKHVAAVCYAFGAKLDEDPFLLFRLRGRSRQQFLADMERAGTAAAEGGGGAAGQRARTPRPEAVDPALFWSPRPGGLPAVAAATAPLGLPEALAEPGWWRGRRPLRDLLGEVYGVVQEACSAALAPAAGGGPDRGTGADGAGGPGAEDAAAAAE